MRSGSTGPALVSDERLAQVLPAAQQGEAWAVTAVYEVLAPRVQGYLRGRGASEPEDLTSEVFLAVLPRLATVTGGAGGLRTFVFSVAHARLVDDLRRRGRRAPVLELDPVADGVPSASAEDAALEAVSTERVRSVLSVLPDDQRDVLLLRIVADLTVEQVAIAIGRSQGAVKQLQRRGLLALRAGVDQGRVPL